jgi:hypothetical protein
MASYTLTQCAEISCRARGGRQRSHLQTGIHLFHVLKALLEFADPRALTSWAIVSKSSNPRKIIRAGRAIVNPLASHRLSTPALS